MQRWELKGKGRKKKRKAIKKLKKKITGKLMDKEDVGAWNRCRKSIEVDGIVFEIFQRMSFECNLEIDSLSYFLGCCKLNVFVRCLKLYKYIDNEDL